MSADRGDRIPEHLIDLSLSHRSTIRSPRPRLSTNVTHPEDLMELSSRPPSRSLPHHPWVPSAERFSTYVSRPASQVRNHPAPDVSVKHESLASYQDEHSEEAAHVVSEVQHLRAQIQMLRAEFGRKPLSGRPQEYQEAPLYRKKPEQQSDHATALSEAADKTVLMKLDQLPAELKIFLNGSVDLGHIKLTKSKLSQMLSIFCPSVVIPKAPLKADLITLYQENVAPILATYNTISDVSDNSTSYAGKPWNYYASPQFNPNLQSSTKAILRAVLKHFVPRLSIPANANKHYLVSLHDRYVSHQETHTARKTRFTRIYAVEEAPSHLQLSCDDLRYRLQMAEPHMFIPRLALKDTLIKIYEVYIQMREDESGDPIEGQDYFWSDLKEF